jgi:benzoate membrane transport protein
MNATSLPSASRLSRLPVAALGSGVSVVLMVVSVFGIVLAAAETLGLTRPQTISLFIALHGLPAILGLALTALYRQPLMATYNFSGLLLLASAAGQYSYREIAGSVLVAGALVVLIGVFGLSARLAAVIPAPIVLAMLAAVVMPFVVRVFTDMASAPALIGLTVAGFLVARRVLSARIPAVLPALGIGLIVAGIQGDVHRFPDGWVMAIPSAGLPAWSWQAVIAISPVLAVFNAVNGNLAMSVYLRSVGYQPPSRKLDVTSGIGTMVGSLFGAAPLCMAAIFAPLTAGPEAGERTQRQWSVYLAASGLLVIALLAGVAVQLPAMVPGSLLFAIAGLALIPVLGQTLAAITSGPLRLGPLLTFAVASSELSFGGLGSLFWALVIGMAVTVVLEPAEYRALRHSGAGA